MKTVTMNLKMKVPQHHHRRKTKRNLGIRSVQIRKEIQAEVGQVDVHEAEEGPGQGLEVDQEVLGDPQEDGVELQADLGIGADQSDRLRGEEVDHVIDLEGAVERPADHVVDRQVVVETKRLIDHAAGLEEEAELPNGLDHVGGLVEEAGHLNGLVKEAGHQVDKGVNQKKEASHQNVLKADVDLHQNRRSARRHQKRKRKKKKNLLLRRRRRKKKQSQRKRRRKRLKRRRKMTKRTPGRPTNMMKKKKKKGKRKKSKECRLSQNRIQRIVLSSGKSRERLETSHTMKSKICFNRSVNF